MQYSTIYKAASLSLHSYGPPKTYLWKNKNSIYIKQNGINCFVTPCNENKSVYVVFKGTTNHIDLSIGLSAIIEKEHPIFHKGYLRNYLKIHKDIQHRIKRFDIDNIIFTGHSMGGSLAISGSYIWRLFTDYKIQCISFGAPRCISLDSIAWFEKHIPHISIEHSMDIIPYFPLHPDLHNLPNKLILDEPSLNMLNNHSISTYKRLLEEKEILCDTTTCFDNRAIVQRHTKN